MPVTTSRAMNSTIFTARLTKWWDTMDARKILSDLQYRINTAPEGDPGFGLKEAMEAAAALNDIVFPTNHLNCDPKQLPHQI